MLSEHWAICTFSALVELGLGSVGDRSPYFQYCLDDCVRDNCSKKGDLRRFYSEQTIAYRLTWWDCKDECAYICMWITVAQFETEERNVPQFYGKWPFLRWAGMQEPASAIFSLLNLLANAYMLYSILYHLPKRAPLRTLWLTYSLVALLTWVWSTVFHTRDYPWTEKMDYFCAFATVMYGFYASLVRILGVELYWRIASVGLILLSYFFCHVIYLGFFRFDYAYNMKANVAIGLANSFNWLIWCGYQHFVHGQRYVWRCAVVIICVLSLLVLELYDFPPILWIFDAHSLWHLGTSPLPFLWTRFVLDDCERLRLEKADILKKRH